MSEDIKDSKLWAAYEKYVEWLSLPRFYCKYTQAQLEEKGYKPELIELLLLGTKKAFCEHFDIPDGVTCHWDKEPELQEKVKKNWKQWCKHLTPGVMAKFYEKTMEEADAGRVKLWLQTIEDEGKDENTVNVQLGIENIRKAMKEDEIKQDEQKEKDNGESI